MFIRLMRNAANAQIEPKRRQKELGSSLEAIVTCSELIKDESPNPTTIDWAELLIVSEVRFDPNRPWVNGVPDVSVNVTSNAKCGRCWRHLPEVPEDGGLCARCSEVVGG
jgi:isoleucyl-tRNA synthetase